MSWTVHRVAASCLAAILPQFQVCLKGLPLTSLFKSLVPQSGSAGCCGYMPHCKPLDLNLVKLLYRIQDRW